jgi:hypothetical protein
VSVEFKENPLLVMMEEVFRSKAPEWKLENAIYSDETRIYSEWQSEKGKVVVQIIIMASSQAAEANLRMFDRKIALGVPNIEERNDSARFQSVPTIQADTILPDLGDENKVWREFGKARSTLIKFRTGNAVVQVAGPDIDISMGLARPLAEHLRSRG